MRGTPHLVAYTASKHGVVGLTRAAGATYAAPGIWVNAVCPGYVRTPMLERALDDAPDRAQVEARVAAVQPVGFATSEEVAAAVIWLCSDAASHVAGIAIPIAGGATA